MDTMSYLLGKNSSSGGGGSSNNEFRIDLEYDGGDVLKTDWAEIEEFLNDTVPTKVPTLYYDNVYKTNIWQYGSDTGTDHFLRFISFEYEGTKNSGSFLIYVYDIKESGVTGYTRFIVTEKY